MEKIIELLLKIIDILTGRIEKERETPDVNFEGEATLGLIVGHTKRSPGAKFALGGNEYDYNKKVAELAKDYADKTYAKELKTHIIFRDVVGISGAYKKAKDLGCDCVIELHFNAFNKKVKGTETLTTTHVGDKDFGQYMQDMQVEVFNRTGQSRGLKPISRSTRGGRNVYSFNEGYNCLVEPFFGDNLEEARLAKEKQSEYAKGLIDKSVEFFIEHLGVLKKREVA